MDKINGCYLGTRSFKSKTDPNKISYMIRFLVWEKIENNSLQGDSTAVVFADKPIADGIKPFSGCTLSREFYQDFKTGGFKPKYTAFEVTPKEK